MGSSDADKKTIKSTETAFDIIETVADGDRPTVSEIAAAVGRSRSTVHYHLTTLQQNRYVVHDEDGFRLGLMFAHLGRRALGQYVLDGVVEKPTNELAAETGTIAHVAVREAAKTVCFYRATTSEMPGASMTVGTETDIHCTASGQAILASFSNETVKKIIGDAELPQWTENTIISLDGLIKRLATVRKLGFAYSTEEHISGVSSIAAPIVDESTGETVGAIGITDHDSRFDDPYKHAKARRFSNELPGIVERRAQVIGNNVAKKGLNHT